MRINILQLILICAITASASAQELKVNNDFKDPTRSDLREFTFSSGYDNIENALGVFVSSAGLISTTYRRRPVLSTSGYAAIASGAAVNIENFVFDNWFENDFEILPMEAKLQVAALYFRLQHSFNVGLIDGLNRMIENERTYNQNPIRDPALSSFYDQLFIIHSQECNLLTKYKITERFILSLEELLAEETITTEDQAQASAISLYSKMEEYGDLACFDLGNDKTDNAVKGIVIGAAYNKYLEGQAD